MEVINDDVIIKKFSELDSKKQKKAFVNALRRGIGILVRQARANLKKEIPTANKVTQKGRFKGLKLINGITLKVNKAKQAITAAILKDGRLKWFELGTDLRRTKQRTKRLTHSTGQIRPINFFSKAKEQTEPIVFQNINQIIRDSIKKIWDKQQI